METLGYNGNDLSYYIKRHQYKWAFKNIEAALRKNVSGCTWRRDVVVNMLVSINKVALHRARLLLAWVIVRWLVNHLGTYPTT